MRTWKKALVVTIGTALLASTASAAPTNYVKLRTAIEGMGGEIAWDQTTRSVKMTINGVEAEVTVGKSEFKLGGEKRKLPGAVELRDDWRTYVPAELVDVLKQTPDLLKLDVKAGLSSRPLIADGDALTDGNKFGSNNDLNVYVPISGSDEGWLATNHETRPGGMSVLRVKRNAEGFYDIIESKAIDFSQVGGTWNNCAGTGTPWGTVLSAEEWAPASNEDLKKSKVEGEYTNFGFLVEVNPATGAAKKLFALGRFSHEGATVLPDRKTVIMGEDQRGGFIFKFVADTAGDLSAGQLYALKLADDKQSGTWLEIPRDRDSLNNAPKIAKELGATPFDRPEETEYNPADGMVYIAETGDDKLTGERSYGRVWKLDPATGGMSIFVQGGPELDLHQPDNIQIDPQGNIWVHEDKYDGFMAPAIGQSKNKLFKFTREGKGEVIAQMPLGAEVTGGFFTPDGSVMFVNVQHPSKPNKSTVMQIKVR